VKAVATAETQCAECAAELKNATPLSTHYNVYVKGVFKKKISFVF
jgi:hypothetical protein